MLTLELLLARWAETRHPDIAELIADHGRNVETAAARELRERKKIPQKEWLALVKTVSLADRGALLASLLGAPAAKVKERVVALEAWGLDPRVTDALHEVIRAIPWVSTSTRTTWTQIFRRLTALADPRTVTVARGYDAAGIDSSWAGPAEWMGTRLEKLAATIEAAMAPPVALEESELQAMDALRRAIPESRAPAASVADSLAHVFANPDDDDARLVLADALQEIGDARGELIALQAGDDTRASRKRISEIVKAHRDELLGPLAPWVMVRGTEFRLGFLDACEMKERVHASGIEAMAKSPLLATIRRLRAGADVVTMPGLISLREVAITGWLQTLEPLLQSEREMPFVSLDCRVTEGQAPLFEACTSLPALRTLVLHGPFEVVAEIARTPLGRQLDALHTNQTERLAELIETIEKIPDGNVTSVGAVSGIYSTDSADWELALTVARTPAGWSEAVLDVRMPSSTWQGSMTRALEAIGSAVGGVRSQPIGKLVVTSRKKLRDAETRERLRATLAGALGDADRVELPD